jgi:hypothetical protein
MYRHTNGRPLDEVQDFDVPTRLWNGAPGIPPLLLVRPNDRERATEPLEVAIPIPVRPGVRDRWLDFRSGYGAFSILAKRCGVELIVPIEPDDDVADLAGRAGFLEGMPEASSPDVDSETLGRMIEALELNALRLDGAPYVTLADHPAVRKVIERTSAGKVAARMETLSALFDEVKVDSAPRSWGHCHIFAWGRRGER